MPRPVLAGAAVLLLALGAAGLASAKGSATHGAGPLIRLWALFAAAALVIGIVTIVKLRERVSATDPDTTAQARLNRGALVVMAVLTAAVPVTLFLMRAHTAAQPACGAQSCPTGHSSGTSSQGATPPPAPLKTTHHAGTFKLPLGAILLVLGILLALLVAALVIALIIRLRRLAKTQPVLGAPVLAEEVEDESALGAALLAGRGALEGEARAAIIACYAAMEASLTQAGVPRLESDSPTDLLARATQRGVVDGPAPRLLVSLFREARFSTHPLDNRHLDQARGALDEITAQLTARQEAERAAAGGDGTDTRVGAGTGAGTS